LGRWKKKISPNLTNLVVIVMKDEFKVLMGQKDCNDVMATHTPSREKQKNIGDKFDQIEIVIKKQTQKF
jgi:hypothetical protein